MPGLSGRRENVPPDVPAYRLWVALDWINMQYNAGIISVKEKEERIKNARKRYEESV